MLCWGVIEQARHEQMSDEYENRYIIICALVAHILSLQNRHGSTTVVPTELNKRGESQAVEH